ncbi:hypothetical protein [Saccharibacillus brassicae]|uniref:Uncharacterized protein n=1 Tax=Saccharibacillus brassicae TaxID=2583377 RepID=A0A4Y6UVT6_SACBS|nr:hypothetical protein [Saccharibacillus brassicae]QDH20377.1 hypothetical protein FFV09_05595 [Saccharibacillus brassicae]
MKWSEARIQFPNRWVLVEAISAYSANNMRNIEEFSVINDYEDTKLAWDAYKKQHSSEPSREYYIFHTVNENIEVQEQAFIGIRGLR